MWYFEFKNCYEIGKHLWIDLISSGTYRGIFKNIDIITLLFDSMSHMGPIYKGKYRYGFKLQFAEV